MSRFQKLLSVLDKELRYQEKILMLLSKEQAAIIRLNQEQMERCRVEKEKLGAEAIALEQQRIEIISECLAQSPSDVDGEPHFADLIANCQDPRVRRDLAHIGEELKETAQAVKKQNELNGNLIRHSLGLITSTIAIMRSYPGTELPTYTPKGRLTARDQDPAFTAPRTSFTRAV